MPIVQGPGFSAGGVDTRLLDILNQAATSMPGGWTIKEISGKREGDPRFHGQGLATDIQLVDPSGKVIPNYQSAEGYEAYQKFAQQARAIQMQKYPELGNAFRWGGYFWNGGPGNYGNADLMHFDLGGDKVGMGGGSWAGGPSAQMRAAYKLGAGGGMPDQSAPAPGAAAPSTAQLLASAVQGGDPGVPEADFSGLSGLGGSSAGGYGGASGGNAQQSMINGQQLAMESAQDRQTKEALAQSIGGTPPASLGAQELGARYMQDKAQGGVTQGGAPLADLFKVGDIGQARQLRRPTMGGIASIQAPTMGGSRG